MILAAEFSRSANARQADFTTSTRERGSFQLQEKNQTSRLRDLDEAPEELGHNGREKETLVKGALIAQFAGNESQVFADAVELIRPHVDGVDLNYGELTHQ